MKRLSNRLKEDSSEKKKSKSLQEAWPLVGYDTEDAKWRTLTDQVDRDMAPLVQDRMQDIACYLYDSNPMAHRIIEINKDFTVGEGFSFKAKEEKVQQVLDDFWNDPVNNWNLKQYDKAKELSIFGEQLYPVFVNKHNGHVRLGYVDPTMINKVLLDPKNPEIFRRIILKSNRRGKIRSFNVINIDERVTSPTRDMLIGDAFFFTINRVTSSTRGRSDLLPLADWIDGLDQFLFARLERANILNAFIWDILLEGADEKRITEFLQATGLPKPGSIRAHNEKVTWNAVTPKLEGNDASNEARLFKMQILGGAGYPEHWFAEGSTTTRACYSEDTETLTENGWKKYWEIKKDEKIATLNPKNNQLVYHIPIKKYVFDIDEDLYNFQNKFVDVMVTKEHKMWTRRKGDKKYQKIKAQDFKNDQYYFQTGVEWNGETKSYFCLPSCGFRKARAIYPELLIPMNDFLEFLGYFLSEGSLRRTNISRHIYTIEISQKNVGKAEKIRKCLKRLPFNIFEKRDKHDKTFRFLLNDKALWLWLYDNAGNMFKNKEIPQEFKNLSKSQLRILLNALVLGDGSLNRKGTQPACYYTASEKLRDDFQELAFKCGFQVKHVKGARCFRLFTSTQKEASIWNPSGIKKIPYKGKVYCFEVPNHLFITRRNGKIGIHSNTALEMTLPTLKKLQSRQNYFKYMISYQFNFVIDQAIIKGTLPKNIDKSFVIYAAPLAQKNEVKTSVAAERLCGALIKAQENGWITNEAAAKAFKIFMRNSAGIDLEGLETSKSKEEK